VSLRPSEVRPLSAIGGSGKLASFGQEELGQWKASLRWPRKPHPNAAVTRLIGKEAHPGLL